MPATVLILSTAHGMGTGAYVVLENLLRAWRPGKVDLHVLTPADSRVGQACRDCDIPWTDWATRTDSLIANGLGLRRLERLPRPDLIHAWHSRGMEWAVLLGRPYRCPTAATLHDHPDASTHGALRRRIMNWSTSRLSALASVSEATASAWRERGCRAPMTVVHNGVPDLAGTRAPGERDLTIGFAGMYNPVKGFATLQNWIKATHDLRVRWKLFGDVAPSLREQALQLVAGSEGTVTLEGFQPSAQIYPEIDLLVHPSIEFDPFPTVLLEAMSAGIPVVATDIGGSREIVRDGVTGFLVPPHDTRLGIERLRALVADASLRQRISTAARERYLAEFQQSSMVSAYATFWDATLARVGGGHRLS